MRLNDSEAFLEHLSIKDHTLFLLRLIFKTKIKLNKYSLSTIVLSFQFS